MTFSLGILFGAIAGYLLALLTFAVVQYVDIPARLARRRWLRHVKRCKRCWPVFQSEGPTWLYCLDGRSLGEKATGAHWCDLRDVLRESDGVPVTRKEAGHAN